MKNLFPILLFLLTLAPLPSLHGQELTEEEITSAFHTMPSEIIDLMIRFEGKEIPKLRISAQTLFDQIRKMGKLSSENPEEMKLYMSFLDNLINSLDQTKITVYAVEKLSKERDLTLNQKNIITNWAMFSLNRVIKESTPPKDVREIMDKDKSSPKWLTDKKNSKFI